MFARVHVLQTTPQQSDTGLEIVREQIRLAAGHRIGIPGPGSDRNGHALLCNIVAERVLRLPPDIRVDKDKPWKDLPR